MRDSFDKPNASSGQPLDSPHFSSGAVYDGLQDGAAIFEFVVDTRSVLDQHVKCIDLKAKGARSTIICRAVLPNSSVSSKSGM